MGCLKDLDRLENIKLFKDDCMNIMGKYPDKYFDLAVVDVPYGINASKTMTGFGAYTYLGGKKRVVDPTMHTKKDWDSSAPDVSYFEELFRISKNQIIWGANHFIDRIPINSSCWIIWDKLNGQSSFSDCEMAWTSFTRGVRKFTFKWAGFMQGNMKDKQEKIHPTQKPKQLYSWIYENFASRDHKIIDTHLGSGSSAISAYYYQIKEFVGIEIDEEYFERTIKRIDDETKQLVLI